jgi:glycosyltransferase involved in cell wall biosynthesis
MMRTSISAIVLTKNEEKNIEQCLASISWCDEIIVVDDYSKDKTMERVQSSEFRVQCGKEKIKIYQKQLNNDFAAQRNFGLEKASGDWVLFIDADEIISEALASEIKFKVQSGRPSGKFKVSGYYIKRRDYFLGRWLKYGETGNIRLLRLAKKNAGKWQGRVHEAWEVKGKTEELDNPILHYPHPTIASFLADINWYTDLVAQYWQEQAMPAGRQGRKIATWEIICYPCGKFVQNYILRFGIFDGIQGLIMAFMMSFHSFLVRSKLWLSQHKNG